MSLILSVIFSELEGTQRIISQEASEYDQEMLQSQIIAKWNQDLSTPPHTHTMGAAINNAFITALERTATAFIGCLNTIIVFTTVVPAKSDSDVMLCLQSYQELRIDRSLMYQSYPQDRLIHE